MANNKQYYINPASIVVAVCMAIYTVALVQTEAAKRRFLDKENKNFAIPTINWRKKGDDEEDNK